MSSSISYEFYNSNFLQNAQFVLDAVAITNATTIPYATVFINGTNISKPTASTIALASGHMYLISCIFKGSVTTSTTIKVTPRFNTVEQTQFSVGTVIPFATTAGVSGTFLADASIASITLDFLYNGTNASTPTGSVSIVQIT